MPSLRHTSPTVRPLARARSASRSRRAIWSAVRRLLMSPSLTYAVPDWDSHNGWTNCRGADQCVKKNDSRTFSFFHHSPLTTHHPPLTTHHSPLTTHHSPLLTPPCAALRGRCRDIRRIPAATFPRIPAA